MDECDNLVVVTLTAHEDNETKHNEPQAEIQIHLEHKENIEIDDNAATLEKEEEQQQQQQEQHCDNIVSTVDEDAAVDAEVEAVIMVQIKLLLNTKDTNVSLVYLLCSLSCCELSHCVVRFAYTHRLHCTTHTHIHTRTHKFLLLTPLLLSLYPFVSFT